MQPDFFGRQVEAGGKLLQVGVQPLGRDEQVDPAVRGWRGEPGFGAERGLVLHLEAERFLAGHIGRGENGTDAGFGGGGRDVEVHDPGMRIRAAEGRSPEHAVAAQVAGVLELAFHLGDAVNPAHRLADPALAPDFDAHAQIMDASLRFTRWPSWTTGRPSTNRCCTGPGLQNRRAATGSVSAPRKARPSTANSATSARFPTSSEPMSSRPRQAAPPRVATRRASRAVIAAAPLRARVVSSA